MNPEKNVALVLFQWIFCDTSRNPLIPNSVTQRKETFLLEMTFVYAVEQLNKSLKKEKPDSYS